METDHADHRILSLRYGTDRNEVALYSAFLMPQRGAFFAAVRLTTHVVDGNLGVTVAEDGLCTIQPAHDMARRVKNFTNKTMCGR